jgi:hypothetical protein
VDDRRDGLGRGAASAPKAWVLNRSLCMTIKASVTPIHSTNTAGRPIKTHSPSPVAMVITPRGKSVYVANQA